MDNTVRPIEQVLYVVADIFGNIKQFFCLNKFAPLVLSDVQKWNINGDKNYRGINLETKDPMFDIWEDKIIFYESKDSKHTIKKESIHGIAYIEKEDSYTMRLFFKALGTCSTEFYDIFVISKELFEDIREDLQEMQEVLIGVEKIQVMCHTYFENKK
jgi:hypothetical protein